MTAATSFYFGIFKKLQICGGVSTNGYPHCDPNSSESLGFNLSTPDDNGIFRALDRNAIVDPNNGYGALLALVNDPDPSNPGGYLPAYPLLRPSHPLANVAEANPLYAMLRASIVPGGPNGGIVESDWLSPTAVVQGSAHLWPIMPLCYAGSAANPSDYIKLWLEFNKPPVSFLNALHDWIKAGKPNDTPTQALNFTKPPASPKNYPVVFVCSKVADDGIRPGPNLDHYWATSRVSLVYATGAMIGTPISGTLQPDAEYNLVAQIGNAGTAAGRCPGHLSNPKVTVVADAFAFHTFMSNDGVSLPALSNLDPSSPNATYEQMFLDAASYDVAGFRFNVNNVFTGLVDKVKAAVTNHNLDIGSSTAEAWVAGGHSCVKVRIGIDGDVHNPQPGDFEDPSNNPRIAQRNLVSFDQSFLTKPLQPPAPWHNFIIEQPLTMFDPRLGESTIRLTLQNGLPADAFKLFLAIPARTFQRYFAGNKGIKGYEVVAERELAHAIHAERVKPFPDAVILRATRPSSVLELAVSTRRRHLGMSLGIVYEGAKGTANAVGKLSMVHEALRPRERKARLAGGFTIEFV